ncbi:hypothetical protein VE02_04686 [Pseudogymnoascus sp. 03VT05]|nr:hypothetical protein VE02_04686 [Pseudogymnoascus sp. 03VT05]
MDEEESVSTPSTTPATSPSTTSPSLSTPRSPPMPGMKMRPFDGNNYNSSRERKRPSVFQGDGLDAFIDIYCSRDGSRSSGTPECLLPPSPMERYYRDEEVPWQLSGTMDGTVAKEPREEREDGERERRLSYVVEDALKVFSGTNEASSQPPNSKSPATIEMVVNHDKNTIPTSEPQESLFHDLMVLSQIERKKKMFTKGAVYTHVRQRKSARKEDDALAVEELGEVDRRGEKRKGKGNSVALGRSGYDSSQRLRSFSVSDEEEKKVKVVKLRDRCV